MYVSLTGRFKKVAPVLLLRSYCVIRAGDADCFDFQLYSPRQIGATTLPYFSLVATDQASTKLKEVQIFEFLINKLRDFIRHILPPAKAS